MLHKSKPGLLQGLRETAREAKPPPSSSQRRTQIRPELSASRITYYKGFTSVQKKTEFFDKFSLNYREPK